MSSMTISQAGRAAVRVEPGGPLGLMRRRVQLEESWRAALERVTDLSLAFHDAEQLARNGGPAIRSRASRRARQLARQTVAERQALAEIEAALDRIADGKYGRCEQCSEPISAAVLSRQPQARYCAACACPAPRQAG